MTAAAFGQRRKMLRQSLRRLTPDPAGLLAAAGIAETRRAEELSVDEFAGLARGAQANRRYWPGAQTLDEVVQADLALAAQPLGLQDRLRPASGSSRDRG